MRQKGLLGLCSLLLPACRQHPRMCGLSIGEKCVVCTTPLMSRLLGGSLAPQLTGYPWNLGASSSPLLRAYKNIALLRDLH